MNEFDDLVKTIHNMGPPTHCPAAGETWDITMGKCACGHLKPLSNFETYHTGLVPAVDNVCPGCRPPVQDMAKLVCARCRAVVARIDPNRDPSGFVFEKGKSYHLDCCAICEYDLVVLQRQPTFILEMLAFLRKKGKAIPTQWRERAYKKTLILNPSKL